MRTMRLLSQLVLLLGCSQLLNALQLTLASHSASQSRVVSTAPLRRTPIRHLALEKQTVGRQCLLASSSVNGGSGSADRPFPQQLRQLREFLRNNFFVLGMVVAVSFARVFPALGKNGGFLRPELFIGKFGVTCIFLLSGLSLQLSELKEAASNYKLNGAVQLVTFGVWPFLVGLPLTKALRTFLPNLLPPALLDGLLILTCLPTTINMCILLTSSSGGNVASSLCNAVMSNLAGIFLTPALLFRFFGQSIHLPFGFMCAKLCQMVLLPVGVGQVLRATPLLSFYNSHTKTFKRLQEIILLGIVYNAFCNAFSEGFGLELKHVLALLTILPTLHLVSLGVLLKLFEQQFMNFSRKEVVAGMFCASHKTLAFGLPLVNTIFQGSPNLAAYCAPIMFIHPLQLIIGSLLVPRLQKYTGAGSKT